MRILIWTQYFWPEIFTINAVARALRANGAEVTILTGKPNYPDGKIYDGYKSLGIQRDEYCGIEIFRIPLVGRGNNSRLGIALNYISFVISGYLFAPYALRGRAFDIVFVYAPSPLLQALPAVYFSWLRRVPLMLWVQDIWPDALKATGYIKNRLLLSSVGLAVRYIYRFSDSILIQSEGFRRSIEYWSKTKHILFFPNIVQDVPHYPVGRSIRTELSEKIAANFSIVYAGNIGAAQSCQTIIEAAGLLQNVPAIKFYLIGSGSKSDYIRKSISESKLENLLLVGRVPPEDMQLIFASSSALLLTLRNEDSLSLTIPSKLQAYLAAGKPILASCNGEAANIVINANAGLTCPPEDGTSLADAVMRLFRMTLSERLILGENGRVYFNDNYSSRRRIPELIRHMKSTISRHKYSD
jgi:glycosyltransferase involved in cell wall biosynthesis